MALASRIRRLMKSPQGRKARERVERMARDPRTQAKIRRLLGRFKGGGGGGGRRPM